MLKVKNRTFVQSQDTFRFMAFKMAIFCFYFTVHFGKIVLLIERTGCCDLSCERFQFSLEIGTDWPKLKVISQLFSKQYSPLALSFELLSGSAVLIQVLQYWKESDVLGLSTRPVCFLSCRSRSLTQHRVWTSTRPLFLHWEEPSHWTAGQRSQSWQ